MYYKKRSLADDQVMDILELYRDMTEQDVINSYETESQCAMAVNKAKSWDSLKVNAIAKRYGKQKNTIERIVKGITYAEIFENFHYGNVDVLIKAEREREKYWNETDGKAQMSTVKKMQQKSETLRQNLGAMRGL